MLPYTHYVNTKLCPHYVNTFVNTNTHMNVYEYREKYIYFHKYIPHWACYAPIAAVSAEPVRLRGVWQERTADTA